MTNYAGHADDPIHSAARVHLREAAVDVQAVRSERRRVHNEVGAQSNRFGHSRADGQETASKEVLFNNIRIYTL